MKIVFMSKLMMLSSLLCFVSEVIISTLLDHPVAACTSLDLQRIYSTHENHLLRV